MEIQRSRSTSIYMPETLKAQASFKDRLRAQNKQGKYLSIGLDTSADVLRELDQEQPFIERELTAFQTDLDADDNLVFAHNLMVIEATKDIVAGYKPNVAFYRKLGPFGYETLDDTIQAVKRQKNPPLTILDAKVGDIDSTNDGYVEESFNLLRADAITVHNYLGQKAMQPFLDQTDKGIFVLARTSNPGGGEFQDLKVSLTAEELHALLNGQARQRGSTEGWNPTMPLFEHVTHRVVHHWDTNGNCGVVAGATYPEEAARMRFIAGPDVPFLIPGVGAQGQKAEDIVPKALRVGELGLINSSRGSIYPKRQEGESMTDAVRRSALTLSQEIVDAQRLPYAS